VTTKILIIEDDLIIAENLKENLIELQFDVIGIASRFQDAVDLFESEKPDLCLVDIYLKGSAKNGIETMEYLNAGFKIPIIYLTSFDDTEFREKAKSTNPSAYLIKPASKKQIDVAIDFALSNFHKKEIETSSFKNSEKCPFYTGSGYFFIKVNDKYEKIYAKDIAFLTASGPYCKISTFKKEYTISANMKSFLEQLNSHKVIRCHRSYAVNIDHIKAFDDISLFVLKGQEVHDIPMSNKYKQIVYSILPRIKAD
jgi:DNA-binding LytR/AlgR family response regulator